MHVMVSKEPAALGIGRETCCKTPDFRESVARDNARYRYLTPTLAPSAIESLSRSRIRVRVGPGRAQEYFANLGQKLGLGERLLEHDNARLERP